MEAAVIKTSGKVEIKEIDASLKSLQELVGGYIEGFHCPIPNATWYCNDEGLLLRLKPNIIVTILAADMVLSHGIPVVGDVVVLGPLGPDGEETPLDPKVREFLLGIDLKDPRTLVFKEDA